MKVELTDKEIRNLSNAWRMSLCRRIEEAYGCVENEDPKTKTEDLRPCGLKRRPTGLKRRPISVTHNIYCHLSRYNACQICCVTQLNSNTF